jgi:hypothetical protein
VRALAVDRQAAAVPDALVGADLDLAPDVAGDLAAQVALDLVVGVDPVAELDQVVVGEVLDADVGLTPVSASVFWARVRRSRRCR